MADKSYRTWQPDQVFLLPPSMRDWLPEGHLVYFLLDVVEGLDLSKIDHAYQKKDHRGERPWNPRMMVALLLYGYCLGVRSSRRLEKATYEDVAFRVLTGGTHPDHSSIADFRKTHLETLSALFLEILRLCEWAGIVKLGRVALDGTKMKANASKHKAMSHGRMVQREAELRAEIAAMLKEAGVVDADEDALHGRDKRGDELPDELRRRQDRLRRIAAAKAELEAEAKAAREAELAEREAAKKDPTDEPPPPELPEHRVKHNAAGEPTDDAQRNFTDPDSRIMKSGKDFVQGYNAQAVVDDGAQVIVAAAVTNQPADSQHFRPVVAAIEENLGTRPVQVLGDAGYYSAENTSFCEALGIDGLLSVGREKHVLDDDADRPLDPRAEMRARLHTSIGKGAYSRRKCIVEPVFGQIKDARGIRTFLLRGIGQVRGEWNLICLTHNLLKLFRFIQRSALATA
jgi:transposase